MFKHIFVYRLKCLLRDKITVFWTILFPLVMATFFGIAFSNISIGATFASIPIAVVDSSQYSGNALSEVIEDAEGESGRLFSVAYASHEQADAMLEGGEIAGYVLLDGDVQVFVKESGYGQTILKEFIDSYLQGQSAYSTILAQNPEAAQNLKVPEVRQYVKHASAGVGSNILVTFYYALIAMAAIYGTFWGNREIMDIQPNLSSTGARVNLSPVHKLKAFFCSACAAVTIHFASLLLLVAYMVLALGVDFAGHLPHVILVCLAGSIAGVSLGAFIAILAGKSEKAMSILSVSVTMALSFLAGLMTNTVKFAVTNAVPLLGYINPANLIADALYSLYYYSTYTRFYSNLGLLIGLSAVFTMVVYLVTRRQKYASL